MYELSNVAQQWFSAYWGNWLVVSSSLLTCEVEELQKGCSVDAIFVSGN